MFTITAENTTQFLTRLGKKFSRFVLITMLVLFMLATIIFTLMGGWFAEGEGLQRTIFNAPVLAFTIYFTAVGVLILLGWPKRENKKE